MLKSEGLSDKEVKIIVDKFDVDGDGVVSWVEFRGAIMHSDLWTRRLGKREMIYLTFDDPDRPECRYGSPAGRART